MGAVCGEVDLLGFGGEARDEPAETVAQIDPKTAEDLPRGTKGDMVRRACHVVPRAVGRGGR